MQRYERLNAVLELLADRGKLSVEEISAEFAVSPATVRRDLDDLAEQGLATRKRGGVVLQSLTYDLPLRYKSVRQPDEKQRIAAAAAAMVSAGAVIGMNGGTTTTAVARAVATRADLSGDYGDNSGRASLTVVTNAVNIAHELLVRPHIKTVVVGGVARPQSYELIGPLAARVLADLAITTLFLGVDAFSPVDGASANSEGEAATNKLMVDCAQRVVVVADSSKVGRHAFARICDVGRIDTLITDKAAAPADVDDLRAAGVRVELV